MKRPYLQLYTRDFLDCKELARCSPDERFVLLGLMCLAHEGENYGFLCDSVGPLTLEYIAARCLVREALLKRAIEALLATNRIKKDTDGCLYVPRMVRDEEIRQARAAGGVKGGNPRLKVGSKVNLPPNLNGNLPGENKVNRALIYDSEDNLPFDFELQPEPQKISWREETFERFWSGVWAKIGRAAALKAWKDRRFVVDPSTAELAIARAKVQGPRLLEEARKGDRTPLHPATWIRGMRWLDEEPVQRAADRHDGIPEWK